ncbi:glycosyltransferase family 4 protein [Cytobacillus horneckiae]|uniref:glycosyltransferase family 4 protein n=1 Tax=Cytobacillus horneckiae TaxID=549687 RepID=UPI0034CF8C96
MTKENILLLSWEYPPRLTGGLARHVQGLAKGLMNRGHEVHVITAGNDREGKEEEAEGIYIHRVQPLNHMDSSFLHWIGGLNIAMEERARALCRETSFDIIHAHDWLVGACALTLHHYMDIPLITTIHGTEYGRNNGIFTELQKFIHRQEKLLIHQSDEVIVCSKYMKKELANLFERNNSDVTVIANGVCERDEFIPAGILDEFPIIGNKKLIFSMGRMVPEKGFNTLIDAARQLKEMGEQYCFVIAGKGPMLEEYKQMVKKNSLEDWVCFPGFISDEQRIALLKMCDIAVFPSLYEPFGIVALEGMLAVKPVIVSNTGGLKDIIDHRVTGLLMQPGEAISLIEQIQYIDQHPLEANELGRNAKKIVEKLYSWKNIAAETEIVYDKALIKSDKQNNKKLGV